VWLHLGYRWYGPRVRERTRKAGADQGGCASAEGAAYAARPHGRGVGAEPPLSGVVQRSRRVLPGEDRWRTPAAGISRVDRRPRPRVDTRSARSWAGQRLATVSSFSRMFVRPQPWAAGRRKREGAAQRLGELTRRTPRSGSVIGSTRAVDSHVGVSVVVIGTPAKVFTVTWRPTDMQVGASDDSSRACRSWTLDMLTDTHLGGGSLCREYTCTMTSR
jgi:hypothetical protein